MSVKVSSGEGLYFSCAAKIFQAQAPMSRPVAQLAGPQPSKESYPDVEVVSLPFPSLNDPRTLHRPKHGIETIASPLYHLIASPRSSHPYAYKIISGLNSSTT